MALKPGVKAPAFFSKDENGEPVKLTDFKGKKLVLFFYPKDQTPGCTAEACNLRDNYKTFQKQGFEILGVSTDSAKSHQKFITKQKLPFRLLADEDKSVNEAYGTWVEKSMYGRKYMGTARVTFIINENGIIEEIIDKVDTKNHTAQILPGGKPGIEVVSARRTAVNVKTTTKKGSAKPAAKKSPTKKTGSNKK
jgi:thioredoxin-dependent peroxiredoxin